MSTYASILTRRGYVIFSNRTLQLKYRRETDGNIWVGLLLSWCDKKTVGQRNWGYGKE